MQYYRCKCGKKEAIGSMSPSPCQGCEICNTTLASNPSFHNEPIPHKWKLRYNQETGEPEHYICIVCSETKPIQDGEVITSTT